MNQIEIYNRLLEQSEIMRYLAQLNDVEEDKLGQAAHIAYSHAQIVFARLAQEIYEGGLKNE